MKIYHLTYLILLISISFYGQTDVFELSRNGTSQEMKLFLNENPSHINATNKAGFTPLILASYANNLATTSCLMKKGANINAMSDMGTALMAATYKNNISIVELLVKQKANIELMDSKGTTALHYACIFNYYEIAKLLLAKKININLKDEKGKTALDYAIENNNIELIKLFK